MPASDSSSSAPSATPDWVRAAARTARRAVLVTFAATAALALTVGAGHWALDRVGDERREAVKEAARLRAEILLLDEKLTMSARMAAASGDRRWVERYEAHVAPMDRSIASAMALAPPDAAARFDAATRSANDALVVKERRAIELVTQGELAAAAALLNGADYDHHKGVLAQGGDRFFVELQDAVEDELEMLKQRSWALFGVLAIFSFAGFAVLWTGLDRRLLRAELAFIEKQDEVARLALHDGLTGLANRRHLDLKLQVAMARARREGNSLALLLLDLDGFKPINDRYGHQAGDAVLVEVGRRLNLLVRKGEITARLGGDEFVVVIEQSPNSAHAGPDGAARAAQRFIAALKQSIELPEPAQQQVHVSASAGVAFFPGDAAQVEDLLRMADVALYRAKAEARGEARFFQPAMDDTLRQREALTMDLRAAISAGHIEPYVQPLVNLTTGAVTGFEILARWEHASRGKVEPAVFIQAAEDSGQIEALTDGVLRAALREARHWDPRLTLAVNIAPRQLRNDSLINRLLAVMAETGFPADRLEVEVTENALIDDLALARNVLLGLKSHGIKVALDDFGTGYSSLNHLSELPFDKIKIDRSFVQTMHQRPESATIVNAIIGLGHSLSLPTLAEGVESSADADALLRMGCDAGQGYHFSRPMPVRQVSTFLQTYVAQARAGAASAGQAGTTLTSTCSRCSPPPRMTPRSGTTSAKSAPQASVT
jgi:diguanylate cyclase (GGDEF)-like protein